MSKLVLEISGAQLGLPGVAAALVELTLALGGHQVEKKVDAAMVDEGVLSEIEIAQFFLMLREVNKDGPQLEAFAKVVQKADEDGVEYEEARGFFHDITLTGPEAKRFGFLMGYGPRWCQSKLGFPCPVVKDGNRFYWRPRRKQAANDDQVTSAVA